MTISILGTVTLSIGIIICILAVIILAAKFAPEPTLKQLVTKDSIIYVTKIETYMNGTKITAKLDNEYYMYRNYYSVLHSLSVQTIHDYELDAIRNTILAETGIYVSVEYIN